MRTSSKGERKKAIGGGSFVSGFINWVGIDLISTMLPTEYLLCNALSVFCLAEEEADPFFDDVCDTV